MQTLVQSILVVCMSSAQSLWFISSAKPANSPDIRQKGCLSLYYSFLLVTEMTHIHSWTNINNRMYN